MQNVGRMFTLIAASMLLIAGCATKNWVQEYFGTKSAEIDQRFTSVDAKVDEQAAHVNQVDSRVSETAQRTEGMGNQLRSLEGSLGEVRGIATAGKERADSAYKKAEESDSRLTRLWASRHKRSDVETVDVLFGFNRWNLADSAQNSLAGLAKELKENERLVVELVGYTDPVGTPEYNVQLSQRRVESVRRFLSQHGVELWRIDSLGIGQILDKALSNDKKRRVTVKLMTFD
jgi:outer membrane protein OmpA-like peptidoglycan-associated protein